MKIEFMHKDAESGAGACPAMYRAPGGFVFQGKKVDADTRSQARDFADDEDLVFIPENVMQQYLDSL